MPSAVDAVERPLSESINIATRSVHAKLNKLVVSRLPLALPPKASDASHYISGLFHVAPLYMTFELLWEGIVTEFQPPDSDVQENPTTPDDSDTSEDDTPSKPAVCSRQHSVLSQLRLSGLARSEALQDDLVSLTGWSRHLVAERIADIAKRPVLRDFLLHIKRSITKHPQVLIAYAWVLYMALFSGGRIIRASLETIPHDFWEPNVNPLTPWSSLTEETGETEPQFSFRFFSFDTPTDGEDLKQTFKKRLAESETLLTSEERSEIVEEARRIFDFMIRLVSMLDDVCGTDLQQATQMLGLRSRDSVVVKKERRAQLSELARRLSKDSEESDSSGDSAKCVRFG